MFRLFRLPPFRLSPLLRAPFRRLALPSLFFLFSLQQHKRRVPIHSRQQDTTAPLSDVIFLQKKQYFDLCFNNQVDFFFLIVYDDFKPETTRQAVRAAT